MGVPKFFRYISERYPCLSELARENCIPEFDNLYLDMNGIIHNCSHPDDSNIHFHIEEIQIFKDICNYVDKLFYLIKPRKVFFMAVDGVAPRAKMNQQRGRRFRSAKEAENLENSHNERGGLKRMHERFDSNCITPGTVFMERLQFALRAFIKKKVTTDSLWKNVTIILSGQDVPGEGEHKIMDYIRCLKSKKDFDPNTRHCLYGLDADLIILGLCTHELHFVILREEVLFGKKKTPSVEQTRFFLLHLGLFREYLELEFDALRKTDPTFDVAKIIDDWVLMGFLVGNDFVPHLPCLHIHLNALPLLYQTYMDVYPKLGGNINENGKLNLKRLEIYFQALAEVEYNIFQEQLADLQYFNAKLSKNGMQEAFDVDVEDIKTTTGNSDLNDLIQDSCQLFGPDDDEEDIYLSEAEQKFADFQNYKKNYYEEKFQMAYDENTKLKLAHSYITALQWIMDYYYLGVQSWDWYFPYHYSPFISDLYNFTNMTVRYNKGKPFLPFQQLLAVLPAASKNLLPEAYRDLMTSPNSELFAYYPIDFKSDLNGKKQEWEAVVLIPFIDEKILLRAMAKCEGKLLQAERERNTHGDALMYKYSPDHNNMIKGAANVENIDFYTETYLKSTDLTISAKKTVFVELPNASRNVFFPGFPTMNHLNFDFELKMARVKVFDYASRNLNMILQPETRASHSDIEYVAEKYLNKVVFVGWPHLIKALVVEVLNSTTSINSEGRRNYDKNEFEYATQTFSEHFQTRMGIELADMSVIAKVKTSNGNSYTFDKSGKINTTDAWSKETIYYPAQCLVSDLVVHQNNKETFDRIEDFFPVGSRVFYIGYPHRGSMATVLNPKESNRIHVELCLSEEPDLSAAESCESICDQSYLTAMEACSATNLSMKVLSRLTSPLMVIPGARRHRPHESTAKYNIGLQFKYPKQQEIRNGYARRIDGQWFYSTKAVDIVNQYCRYFYEVVQFLRGAADRGEFCFEGDLCTEYINDDYLKSINDWIKSQEHMKVDAVHFESTVVEKETIEEIMNAIENSKNHLGKRVRLCVKPQFLIKPDVTPPLTYKSELTLALFHRVVVVRTTYTVPIGTKGTIIGIYPSADPNPVRVECVNNTEKFYDVFFDQRVPSCCNIYDIAEERVYRLPESALLHVSDDDFYAKAKPRVHERKDANDVLESIECDNSQGRNQLQRQDLPSFSKSGHKEFWNPPSNLPAFYPPKYNENSGSSTGATPRGRGKQQKYQTNFNNSNRPNSQQQYYSNSNAPSSSYYQWNKNNQGKNNHKTRNHLDNAVEPNTSGSSSSNYPRITILKKPQTMESSTLAAQLAPFMAVSSQSQPVHHHPTVFGSTSQVPNQHQHSQSEQQSITMHNNSSFATQPLKSPTSNNTANTAISDSAQQQTLILRNMLGLNSPQRTQLPQPPIFWQRQAQNTMENKAAVAAVPNTTNIIREDFLIGMEKLSMKETETNKTIPPMLPATLTAPMPKVSFSDTAITTLPRKSTTPDISSLPSTSAAISTNVASVTASARSPSQMITTGAESSAKSTSQVVTTETASTSEAASGGASLEAVVNSADCVVKATNPPRKKRLSQIGARFDFA